jgi:F-type H+-transporting ATPase subunit epsilon
MLYVEILSPERAIYKGNALSVKLPGTSGSFQVLDLHADLLSTLEKGNIALEIPKEANTEVLATYAQFAENNWVFQILGGTVEVQNNKLVVLVD